MSFVVHRVTKSAARYTDAGGREKCGYCRFFVPPRSCGKVIGPVSPMGWCKHFSRQMVSQFGGGGSTPVGGGPPGMTLDLNFMSSGNMPAGITFSRASSATYTDSTGTIQTAAINAPRWDHAGGSLRGLLIEEARTNICLRSGNLADPAWSLFGSVAAVPGVTGNNVTAPDGTVSAARIVYPAVSGATAASVVYQTITFTAASYTASIWLRGAIGGEQVYLIASNGAGVFSNSGRLTLTTAWQRFQCVFTGVAAAGAIEIGTDLRDASQTATSAQTIYAWGAQVEQGAFPTSLIPTTSVSVTRAADGATMPTNVSWYSATTGTVMAETLLPDNGNNGYRGVFVLDAGGFGTWLRSYTFTGSAGVIGSADAAGLTFGNMTPGTPFKIAANYSPAGTHVAMAGVIGTGTASTIAASTYTTLRFGVGDASNANAANGYLRRINYWNRALSDTEMQQVTT